MWYDGKKTKAGATMTLENGRPENIEGREEKEIKAYDFLDTLGVEYTRVDHEAAMTMEACAEIDKALGTPMCKNLFLCNRQETQFYLLLIPADKPFKTKDLSAQLGCARLSFGKAEHMERLLDITPGSLTLLGLINNIDNSVQLLIDEDVFLSDFVCMHPCVNTSSIRVKTEDVVKKLIPAMHHEPIYVTLPREQND